MDYIGAILAHAYRIYTSCESLRLTQIALCSSFYRGHLCPAIAEAKQNNGVESDTLVHREKQCTVNDPVRLTAGQQPHLYEQRRTTPKSPHLLDRAGGEGESITLSLSAARVITAG